MTAPPLACHAASAAAIFAYVSALSAPSRAALSAAVASCSVRSYHQSINQSTLLLVDAHEGSINQSTNQSINQPTNQSALSAAVASCPQ